MPWRPPPEDESCELRARQTPAEWSQAIGEICARHGIPYRAAAPFPTGSDVVWAVDEVVIKFTDPSWAWQIEAEERHLARAQDRLPVHTPRPLERGELHGWPYLIMTRVPGVALGDVWPELPHEARIRMAEQIGRLTRALHTLDASDEPGEPERWSTFWKECCERRLKPEPDVPATLLDEREGYLAQRNDELAQQGAELKSSHVFLHTELLDQHILVEERGDRWEPCALIDFADGRLGPAEYEFPAPVEFLFRGEPGLLRSFLRSYGYEPSELTPELSERLLAWGLSHRYGRLQRMLQALKPHRPRTLRDLAHRLYGVAAS